METGALRYFVTIDRAIFYMNADASLGIFWTDLRFWTGLARHVLFLDDKLTYFYAKGIYFQVLRKDQKRTCEKSTFRLLDGAWLDFFT